VVAVADGLGGVPDSATTASRAVAAAVRAATEGVGPAPIQLTAALKAANAAADGGGATTIVLAVLAPDGQASLIRVGDSTAIVIRDGGTSWQELFAGPDDDEGVVATVTAALPTGDPVPEEAEVALGPGDVLVLMTDGVADPWRDGPKTVAPALSAALAAHPDPWELAHLADFSRQGCHDDRTLVAIWPRASNG
jgi:serine/threonine protein phosphatase PrpC